MLVLFENGVSSACGFTSAAVGPFYCPGDSKVYIDLGFFRELQRMGAGGDFAQAYVLAHEVGHHIQNLLGVVDGGAEAPAAGLEGRGQPALGPYASSRRTATRASGRTTPTTSVSFSSRGDLEEGMNAAATIGDDALMSRAGARVRPEAFTHGSSEQRQEWLYRGLETGGPAGLRHLPELKRPSCA